jgi:hypothetical protein
MAQGSDWATIGKPIFTHVYIEKKNSSSESVDQFNKTWYKSFLSEENIYSNCSIKGQGSLQHWDNHESAKIGWVI